MPFKMNPSDYVKYLGVYLDKNLSWDYQINQVSKKLSCANGIISKRRHLCPRDILIYVYYSIFYSHLYGCRAATTIFLKIIGFMGFGN